MRNRPFPAVHTGVERAGIGQAQRNGNCIYGHKSRSWIVRYAKMAMAVQKVRR